MPIVAILIGTPLAVSLVIAIILRLRWERKNPPTDPKNMTMSQLLEWEATERRRRAREERQAREKRLLEWNRLPERSE